VTITRVFSGIPLQVMTTVSFAGDFDADDLFRDPSPSLLLSWSRLYVPVDILLDDSSHNPMIPPIRTSSLNNARLIIELLYFSGVCDADDLIQDTSPSRLLPWTILYIPVETLLVASSHKAMIRPIWTPSLDTVWLIIKIPMTYYIQ
jgi:hypothetical protein